MRQFQANNRWFLLSQGKKGEDEFVDYLLDNPEDRSYLQAKALNEQNLKRAYLEACLTATQDFEKIGQLLSLTPEVVECYAKIYYDISELDVLSTLSLIDEEDDDFAKSLKNWALSQGLEFLSWRLGQQSNIRPVEGLQALFSDCYYKSKEAFFNQNSSVASKESVKWVKMTTDIGRLLKMWLAADEDETQRAILLQLKRVDPNFESVDDLDLPED